MCAPKKVTSILREGDVKNRAVKILQSRAAKYLFETGPNQDQVLKILDGVLKSHRKS